LDDQVLLKSDGYPTYHLAVVVDDHLMHISHIIRGDEWLSSTPKHVLLYRFFGWELPVFVHTPLLLNIDKSKISKRKSPEKTSLDGFRSRGYLPEALLNFLAALGWSHPQGKEVYSLAEFVDLFRLDQINKSGSIFDLAKLNWLNGVYIRAIPTEELAARLEPYTKYPPNEILRVLPVLHERIKLLGDFDDLARFFFEAPTYQDPTLFKSKQFAPSEVHAHLITVHEWLTNLPWPSTADDWESGLRTLASELGFRKAGDLFMLLRVAVTGRRESPPLYETMIIMGRPEVLNRINLAIDVVSKQSGAPPHQNV
jgi:glutamyl-tRNA synthetase